MNGGARGLALMERLRRTRKWAIMQDVHFSDKTAINMVLRKMK